MCTCDSGYMGRFGKNLVIKSIGGIVPTTNEVTQGMPLVAAVYELPCSFFTDGGNSTIEELDLLELATADGNSRRGASQIQVFNQLPTTPVIGTLYDTQTDRHVASFFTGGGVASAANQRTGYLRLTGKKHRAVMNIHTNVQAHVSYHSLWAVLLADATFQHVSGTTLELGSKIWRHI